MLINTAYRLGSFRLNSWHRAERQGDIVRRFDRSVLGGETVTEYRFAGFDIDWQGNATRKFEKVN